jgi:hypothetical protein
MSIANHIKKRALERYNYVINRKARTELLEIIKNNKCKIIKYDGSAVLMDVPIFLSKEMMRLNNDIKFGDLAKVIYHQKLKRIVTFLPIEIAEKPSKQIMWRRYRRCIE